jgi:hypothetical protein
MPGRALISAVMGQLGSRSELNGPPTALSDRPLVAAKLPFVRKQPLPTCST